MVFVRDIALIAHHDTGRHGEIVGAVIPLLPLRCPDVLVRGQHSEPVRL